ncbi:DNA mismatch repair endonuclease MutL [Paenibacillus sp. SYP-B4298]|uniref:DNA mismatch repair endonuclease MutL n=1 Tax=Paenibacillus sp. SYP-B4298 TaxID=2996034 RepID=UPI0022DE7E15|nr:DNA mismatch repair endonuclease MutL [Paenibacillus sp. SYP-B4298]
MAKIHVLDEQLANQIAAGEVVERPSSVVKELVENAVDAGSTTIDVAIEEGGLTFIRVRDNGAGIEADDLELAFLRHATSKLLDSRDLFRIASLGFRGEALPSIAAVAKVECVTAADDSGLGVKLLVEGGKVVSREAAASRQGTEMIVRDLFYNTPARLKYMKSIQTELGHISDYMYRLAMAHPGIAFTLKHNGTSLLRTLGNGDRLQVIAAVYGTTMARAMLPVAGEHPDYTLRGYVSKPEQTRANRNGMTTIVNGRYIRSFILNQSILQAFHTLLPINRFPLTVLEIGMHPSLVDVNVHPSKMEVRFSKEAELKEFVQQSVREALSGYVHIPSATVQTERDKPAYVQQQISFFRPDADSASTKERQRGSLAFGESGQGAGPAIPAGAAEKLYKPSPLLAAGAELRERADGAGGLDGNAVADGSKTVNPGHEPGFAAGGEVSAARPPASADAWIAQTDSATGSIAATAETARRADDWLRADGTHGGHQSGGSQPNSSMELSQDTAGARAAGGSQAVDSARGSSPGTGMTGTGRASEPTRASNANASAFPELSWVGQLHGTYLVAQNESGMYLIDQHAAHERIHYEYYYHKFGQPEEASQQLLVPHTLEFTTVEAEQLRGRLELFAQAGLEIEPFGTNAFLVRSHPQWLPKGDELEVIEEIAEWILAEKRAVDVGKLREKSAILCSCKASIKANQRLTREEGEALITRLAACNQPYTCPHGRPIVVHLSTYQLEKMFKRVM